MKAAPRRFLFSRLSIQQRLPLLICVLLLAVIITFGYTAYLGIKNAELSAGKERLKSLTNQLGALFQHSNSGLIPFAKEIANSPGIKTFLQTNGKDSGSKAKLMLDNAREDSIMPLLELFKANKTKVLSSDTAGVAININRNSILPDAADTSFGEVGKLYRIGNKTFCPVVVAVTGDTQTIGYIVMWRRLTTTQKEIDAVSQLMGEGSAFYLGNDDGSFWTNGLVPVPAPPVDLKNVEQVISYSGPQNFPVIASAKRLANSRWLLLIALSQQKVVATANNFLSWIFIVGSVLIIAGILVAWFMSRSITKPLKNLTAAASAIAKGNYSLHVEVNSNDELAKLADAFNTMAVQVHNAQHDLEKKVEHRTAELETANKELEAFSYSVSHDLHTPLRIIDGYATVLSKKFSDKLDECGGKNGY
jgi:methyl-accepting chemotaxis protein